MTVTIDEIPMWTHRGGHILVSSEGQGEQTRWSTTLCGIWSTGHYMAVPDRPKRVCKNCRVELRRANEANPDWKLPEGMRK